MPSIKWDDQMDQILIANHDQPARILAEWLGTSPHGIYQRRFKLGLTKWEKEPKKPYAPKSRWPRSLRFYRRIVLARDGGRCVYCGNQAEVVDHVIPVHLGGINFPSNLVAACARCNGLKGTSCAECPRWRSHAIS